LPRNTSQTNPPVGSNSLTTVFLADTGYANSYSKYRFDNGSINYVGIKINQDFKYFLIDNIGTGNIRFCINRPDLDMSVPVYGAKTLKPGDAIYFEETVWQLNIYYVEDSSIELVLKNE
jgi:hypothetical protein